MKGTEMPVRFWRHEGNYNIYVDTLTGVERRVKLASDAQMSYINSMRSELGKAPLKGRYEAWKAIKTIEKLKDKLHVDQQSLL